MLVQVRTDGRLRLIAQHQHALASGALAGRWFAPPHPDGLGWATVVAASLHDVIWLDEDRTPSLDADTGRPHDFISLPRERKRAMVSSGLERLKAVEPEVGALVEEHHRALLDGRPAEGAAGWVALLDTLALRICLTPPGSEARARPEWLEGRSLNPPGWTRPLELAWIDETALQASPYPFQGPRVRLELPYRDLAARSYRDAKRLSRDFRSAPVERWTVDVVPPAA